MFKKLFKPKATAFAAPFKGELMSIESVNDPVFSSKAMGDGFAIKMLDGTVKSPVNGKIVALFPTGHAIGIKAEDRNEYLIHLGIDTVKYEGKGFKTYVKLDQEVKQGDLLVEVDLAYFSANNVDMTCPILVTNANNRKIILLKEGIVESQETAFLAIKA